MQQFLFSDSFKYLIILSKSNWTKDELSYLEKNRVDERQIFILSERHRITPLIWSNLQKTIFFSSGCRQQFQLAARQNQLKAIQAKVLQGKLQLILKELGIMGFFLKGIGIAERFYHDIGERHVLDLDWFVGVKGVEIVSNKLFAMGYVASPDISQFNHTQWKYFKSTHHDINFSPPSGTTNLPIELHWRLRSPWSDFAMITDDNMSVIDEFLYLCVHGTEHGWFRLKWILDLPRMIDKIQFDWVGTWKRAEQLNCQKHLSISLLLMDELTLMSLPFSLKDKISRDVFRPQLKYINRVIHENNSFNANDRNRWHYLRYLWSLRSCKLNFSMMKLILTSPADWQFIRLSSSLFPLYFLFRPFLWVYRRIRA